ncbi:MAG TPA: methyltransferase domain-containing protein [Phototrophicaceae bacterium]|nr:methyltransferase domain-containing protein [Phototrophicaceae bacterium]
MTTEHSFDRTYWERHWHATGQPRRPRQPHPYLAPETAHLQTGRALDAGCGAGAEAVRLAELGWHVTGVDISRAALSSARRHGLRSGVADRLEWVEADLLTWEPGRTWDLVVTSYAHPAAPQLDLYRRLATWVAPGGTLLVVAHLAARDGHHPAETTAGRHGISALFTAPMWQLETTRAHTRTVTTAAGLRELADVVVRVSRTA